VALPMPELPPVISTILFSKLFMVGLNVSNAEYSVVDEWMDNALGKSDPPPSIA
jgi:hypothetical protein